MHIKDNLVRDIENKCYKDYGYVCKIYSVLNITNGIIQSNDPTSSASFDITYSCKLCKPIMKNNLICQIKRMNKKLIQGENGPMIVIVPMNNINSNNFFIDTNGNLRNKNKSKSIIISEDTFMVITILQCTFYDTEKCIKVLGFLDSLASDEQIKQYYDDLYNSDESSIMIKSFSIV